jgi:hypothetical protein
MDDHAQTAARPAAPSFTDRWGTRSISVVLLLASCVAFAVARGRNEFRCHQSCYGSPPLDRYGSLSYEPGHAWTAYTGSWEWSGQYGLAIVALIAGLAGVALTLLSRRDPRPAFATTGVALVAWLAWVLLSPAIP